MDLEIAQMAEDEEQLIKLNEQLKIRSEKFGSEFNPLTLSEFKLFKIQKASETGNIKYLEGLLLNDIADLQERKRTIQDRTSKFFQSIKVESDQNKFFAERTVPDFSEDDLKIRENSWYLFGVDYMSNEKIRHYFSQNPHFKIQWINDSACNIVYNSKEQAEAAVKPYRKGDSMTDQNAQIWYEMQEYDVEGVKRKLFSRMATNRDSKKQNQHGHQSQYYRWMINKQKIGSFVKSTAKREMYRGQKTKGISKKYGHVKKRQESQDEESSSGVDNSDSDKPVQKAEEGMEHEGDRPSVVKENEEEMNQ